jgi:hypothetical protein
MRIVGRTLTGSKNIHAGSANIFTPSNVIVAVAEIGTVATLLAAYALSAHLETPVLQVLAVGVMVSGATASGGFLLGFLFGIPHASRPANGGDVGARVALTPSTNLEQVADWLTKILLGAGLTQIGSLGHAFARFTATTSGDISTPPNRTLVGAVLVYSAVTGFLDGWLVARIYLTRAVSEDMLIAEVGISSEPNADEGGQGPSA